MASKFQVARREISSSAGLKPGLRPQAQHEISFLAMFPSPRRAVMNFILFSATALAGQRLAEKKKFMTRKHGSAKDRPTAARWI